MPPVFARTTTTEVARVVGEPLPSWIPWTAGVVVLVLILLAGWYAGRRSR